MYPTKRLLDVAVALVGLLVALPILLPASAYLALVCRASPLFVQDRVGLGERPFLLYKLRTMRPGSDRAGTGSVTVRADPRVVPGGHIVRSLKIDELPQLLNVLNGTMSVVGPRPTVTDDYAQMSADQRRRAAVRPGLTGLAQVNGNTALPWPQRIRYDLDYVDRASLMLDVAIIAKTAYLLVSGRVGSDPAGTDEWGNT